MSSASPYWTLLVTRVERLELAPDNQMIRLQLAASGIHALELAGSMGQSALVELTVA